MRYFVFPALAALLVACGQGEPLTPPDAVLPDGGRYRGTIVDGRLQGPGRIDYPGGAWYEGPFKNGQAHGRGRWHGAQGDNYSGEFEQGEFHGLGTLIYRDGSRYEGGFKLGRLHGEGTLKQNGLSYRGGFANDKYQGPGKLVWPDGSSFQGRFTAGEPDGEGLRRDTEGNQYSGRFVRGHLEGEGGYTGADGSHYTGGFAKDEFDGRGRYQNSEGEVWSGTFKRGELRGTGEYHGDDGSHYQGEFSHWRYHGQGKLRQEDGTVYQGQFEYGEYSGVGTLSRPDGRQEAGSWQAGLRVRDGAGQLLPDPLELGLLRQGKLLDEALAALPASTPASELYTLTLAGDGQQSVFLREADYVSRMLVERFGAHGQVSLVNHRDHLADRPLATRESLSRAVQAIAERAGPEDLVFLYLTSHGSSEHEFVLAHPRLRLSNLPAQDLATLLAPLKERHKVLVISACYSGGFIGPLKDEKTLIMTAADVDRKSFGCSEESEFTYFGRALFAEALRETDDLEQAFALAKAKVTQRELDQDYQPSQPQLWAPQPVLAHWRKLRAAQAAQALTMKPSDARDETPR